MKRFKAKRRKKTNKLAFLIFLFLISIIFLKIMTKDRELSKEEIAFVNSGLNNYPDIDLELLNPKTILHRSLNYLIEVSDDIKMEVVKETPDNPTVYIYNTHQSESYDTNLLEAYNISYTVWSASLILKDYLKDYGINAVVEENSVSDYLKNNNLKYKDSYKASRFYLNDKLAKYPSIKYLIDLHRDSSNRKITTFEDYAKIAFVVGLDNPNYEPNLNLATRLNNSLDSNITRGIIKKSGKKSNGVYNQDASPNSILIEVGGPENGIEEVSNTLKVFASVLAKEIKTDEI